MMIRTFGLLIPVTITPLLAVETVETVMIRGPLSHIALTVQDGTATAQGGRSEVVSGLSVLPVSAMSEEGGSGGLNLMHALRF